MIVNFDKGIGTNNTIKPISLEDYNVMADCFEEIRMHKDMPEVVSRACMTLKKYILVTTGLECSISVTSDMNSAFYGINVYPEYEPLKVFLDCISNADFADIKSNWVNNKRWHIDIDGKMLYDISNKLTAREMVAIMLYRFDSVIFNSCLPMHIIYAIYKHMTKVNFIMSYLTHSQKCRNLYMIPIVMGIGTTNFIDKIGMDGIYGLVSYSQYIHEAYRSAYRKILVAYGTLIGFNLTNKEVCDNMRSVLNWLYEGINDLKFSSMRLKKRLTTHLHACRSPYIRELFKSLIMDFSNIEGKVAVKEGFSSNPMLEKMNEQIEIDYWKKYVSVQEDSAIGHALNDVFYPGGIYRKISLSDIDMLRVEAENIESVDDKVYLLEKVYKVNARIDSCLEALEDKHQKYKVKQSRSELLHLKEELNNARMYIIQHQVGPERYGLFIKYPAGYEG